MMWQLVYVAKAKHLCAGVLCRYAKLQDQVAQQTYQVATSQKSLQQSQDQASLICLLLLHTPGRIRLLWMYAASCISVVA